MEDDCTRGNHCPLLELLVFLAASDVGGGIFGGVELILP
jgi:hypothetical protein